MVCNLFFSSSDFRQFVNEKELDVYAEACKQLTGLELTQWRDKANPTSSESYIAKVGGKSESWGKSYEMNLVNS